MAKTKYIFNDKSLSYEATRTSPLLRIFKTLLFLITALAFSFGIIIFSYTFFESPKERMLKSELSQYELQYQIMNHRLDNLQALMDEMSDRDDNIYRIIFEAEPIPKTIRQAGFGGVDRYAKLEGYNNSELLIETAKKLDNIASALYVQSKSFDDVYDMARNKEKMLSCIPAIQPVSNKELKRLSSFYGYRIDPIYKIKKFHSGVDFSAPQGTLIYASGAGTVVNTKRSNRGYGNTVTIDHGYGYHTFYAHNRDIMVKRGDKVTRGQIIATVGNSGKSTAPHLHYEVRKNKRTINPIFYFFNDLSPDEFETILNLSKLPTQSLD
ncbi:MAG: M23 family metallopeptidase [Bacteroidetes bacterium]|nr:M23 family metallopeptidase [Bacteroidota bacterium]MBL6943129.1 M23 family metallopeptidase [Bacteroidales bacterium]